METTNEFNEQLNTALEKISGKYSQEVQKSTASLNDTETTLSGAVADQKEAQSHLKEAKKLSDEVKGITNKSVLAGLISKNSVTLATSGNTAATQTSQAVGKAAKSIDAMLQSVTVFASGIASVYAKVNSEDKGSELAKQASALFDQSKKLALQAEKTSNTALDAAINAAQSRTAKMLEVVTNVSTNVNALSDALNKTLTSMQGQVADLEKTLSASVVTEETARLAVEQADISLKSAQMIGGNDGSSLDAITGGTQKEAASKAK